MHQRQWCLSGCRVVLQGLSRGPLQQLEAMAPANSLSAGGVLLQDCDDNLFSTYYWVELPVGSGCGKVRLRLRALASDMP